MADTSSNKAGKESAEADPNLLTPNAAGSSASPAATIRQQRGGTASPLGLSGMLPQLSPHRIGLGRAPNTEFRIHGSNPATPMSPSSYGGRAGSISSIDEDDWATPRTGSYFPPAESMGRRVSTVSDAKSPTGAPGTGPGSLSRSSRPRTTGDRSGAVSRSASRARLTAPPQQSPSLKDMDDDEVEFIDRGEDLIRRRLKERKRAKRERERRAAAEAAEVVGEEEEEEGEDSSAPPSAQTETFPVRAGVSPVRASRANSRARAPSNTGGARVASTTGYPRAHAGSVTEPDRPQRPQSLLSEDGSTELEEDGEEPEEDGDDGETEEEEDDESGSSGDGEGVTVRDRQDAINIEHPFGLPIWKPALYRKSRSVTRDAESALHSMPSATAERHLLPGNILWTLLFGWWLALACFIVAVVVSGAEILVGGRGGYGQTLRGLAWYIGWPFGKYVEGEGAPEEVDNPDDADQPDDEEAVPNYGSTSGGKAFQRTLTESTSSTTTVRAGPAAADDAVAPSDLLRTPRRTNVSFAPGVKPAPCDESSSLFRGHRKVLNRRATQIGSLLYWPGFLIVVAPLMLLVCVICWFLVITIPMAKLIWELLWLLWRRPLEISFRSAPKVPMLPAQPDSDNGTDDSNKTVVGGSPSVVRRARLKAGQVAPTAGPTSTVLLCAYRAVGWQYYKYTVGGVNIMFINLLPLVFFTIFDGIILLPAVEKAHHEGKHVSALLNMIASPALIFILGIASVIPLSYFLGMAVASISAQSSIGMGAVINATFGSIIEIVLYGVALSQGKGRLVEGSIVGSILAGVLLMPGMSMCSGALKRKEQKFNAKSAGVTSTMLIMAIIGTLTPTLFYQTYGSFQIHCEGCPRPGEVIHDPSEAWKCNRCIYEYPDPTTDPFYQNDVKPLMYACAAILLFSYLIGLWFSLRTHASQIWQNPQQLMAKEEIPQVSRSALARITPAALNNPILPVHQQQVRAADGVSTPRGVSPHPRRNKDQGTLTEPPSPFEQRRETAQPRPPYPSQYPQTGYTPLLESFGPKTNNMESLPPLPGQMTQEDFRRAVHTIAAAINNKKVKAEDDGGAAGHEAPSWTRGVSAAVLLSCTLLYAIIAEVLVDVVDVVLKGSGVDEKFLGLTLFALVPNTTEFMNAMSFAMHGNIALSMEIGSAYALQVCLLQIPAMVAFSALSNPSKVGEIADTFTLIFPRWDVIAIILSIFLLTYTYIEARSNYHRGSILVLAYCVLVMGFYYAPPRTADDAGSSGVIVGMEHVKSVASSLSSSVTSSFSLAMTKLWA